MSIRAVKQLIIDLGLGRIAVAASQTNNTLANTHILVGNASNVATDVALSGDAAMANTGAITVANGAITRAKMSIAAALISKSVMMAVVPASATPTINAYVRMANAGTISGVKSVCSDTLATSDTNYLTFTITNLTGTKVILLADATNTTKATGGAAWTANTSRTHALTATGADLVVAAGDWLKITATGTGTPANAVNASSFDIEITATA